MPKLIWITPDAEQMVEYIARVSNPKNQAKMESGELTPGRLLRYCADHGHWSIFEMASACVEVETTRAISAQILRHRSFSFQEFSQRYAEVDLKEFPVPEMRLRAQGGNRQGSVEADDWGTRRAAESVRDSVGYYHALIDSGVAPETARMVLPMCSPTRLYMAGTLRSWIHYLAVRTKPDVQKEHRQIAEGIQAILADELPILAEAFGWS